MELRAILKDGCHASEKGTLPVCEKTAFCPRTGIHAVTTSKYIDYWLIPALACDICHSEAFSSVPVGSRGLSLGEGRPGRPVRTVMSRLGQLLAERVEPISVPDMSAPEVRRRAPTRVPSRGIADGGFAAENDGWLSR